jgi:hypothetical protein
MIVVPVRKKNTSMLGIRRDHPFAKASASVSPPKYEKVSLRTDKPLMEKVSSP